MRNIAFALGGQILNILMSFAMRTVFVNTLGEVYPVSYTHLDVYKRQRD